MAPDALELHREQLVVVHQTADEISHLSEPTSFRLELHSEEEEKPLPTMRQKKAKSFRLGRLKKTVRILRRPVASLRRRMRKGSKPAKNVTCSRKHLMSGRNLSSGIPGTIISAQKILSLPNSDSKQQSRSHRNTGFKFVLQRDEAEPLLIFDSSFRTTSDRVYDTDYVSWTSTFHNNHSKTACTRTQQNVDKSIWFNLIIYFCLLIVCGIEALLPEIAPTAIWLPFAIGTILAFALLSRTNCML